MFRYILGPSLGDKQTNCATAGGHLKDGAIAEGQYCFIYTYHNTQVKYNFDDSKNLCEGMGGTLTMINTLEIAKSLLNETCSRLDPTLAGQKGGQCGSVSKKSKQRMEMS